MTYGYGFDVEQDYFHWLCEMVHIEQEDKSYWILAKELHNRTFYSLIDHDENRAYDGIELREDYLREINYPKYVEIEGDCSVLEMLIALARRMAFETGEPYDVDDNEEDHTAYWFWEMMDNLDLSKYDDESYADLEGHLNVDFIIDNLLERDYKPNGTGGLFPLKKCRENQRKVELWYQMNAYLNEREVV